MSKMRNTMILLLCLTMVLFTGLVPAFAQDDSQTEEESTAAVSNTESNTLEIQWLDLGGTGMELNEYSRQGGDYITVRVNRFYDTGNSGYRIIHVTEGTMSQPLYYEYVEDVSDGMAAVLKYDTIEGADGTYEIKNAYYGYVDATGKEVIAPAYLRADDFHQGYAAVSRQQPAEEGDLNVSEDGLVEKYGIIDKQGNVVVDFIYDNIRYMKDDLYEAVQRTGVDENGQYIYKNGILHVDGTFTQIPGSYIIYQEPYVISVGEDNAGTTYYDCDGNPVTPQFANKGSYNLTGDANLIPAMNNEGKWGVYDVESQRMAVDFEYDILSQEGFSEGLIGAGYESTQYGENGSLWWRKMGFIDQKGTVVIPFDYEYVQPFSEGIATVKMDQKQAGVNTGYGAVDTSGNQILPIAFSYVGTCQDGTIPVTWQNSLYGFYNDKGEKITPYKYSFCSQPYEGIRIVGIKNEKGQSSLGAINRYGNEVIPLEYSGLTPFYNGKALIGTGYVQGRSGMACEKIGILERPASADYDTGQANFISVTLNGEQIQFDQDPLMINDRVMVPMRAIFEAVGASVQWNQNTQTVHGEKDGITVDLEIGNTTAYVNGEEKKLDTPAVVQGGRTLVPVRFIAESLQADVQWDQENLTVLIQMEPSGEESGEEAETEVKTESEKE